MRERWGTHRHAGIKVKGGGQECSSRTGGGPVGEINSRFLTGLGARFGMTNPWLGARFGMTRNWDGLAGILGLGFHVGAEDGVDTGLVAFAVFFEPLHDVVVDADG